MQEDGYTGPHLGEVCLAVDEEDGEPDLSGYAVEDWAALAVFWLLAAVVFLQFFTRYVLNDSLGWTEEMARYLLMCVCFLGGGLAVRKCSHIHVEFLYLYLPGAMARGLSLAVDAIRVVFFAYATWLCWLITRIMHRQPMVVVDWPMSIVYGICTLGLAVMTVRAAQVAAHNWKTKASPLVRVREEGRHQ